MPLPLRLCSSCVTRRSGSLGIRWTRRAGKSGGTSCAMKSGDTARCAPHAGAASPRLLSRAFFEARRTQVQLRLRVRIQRDRVLLIRRLHHVSDSNLGIQNHKPVFFFFLCSTRCRSAVGTAVRLTSKDSDDTALAHGVAAGVRRCVLPAARGLFVRAICSASRTQFSTFMS